MSQAIVSQRYVTLCFGPFYPCRLLIIIRCEVGFYENIDINFSQHNVLKTRSLWGFSEAVYCILFGGFFLNIPVGFCGILVLLIIPYDEAKLYYLYFLKSCNLAMKISSASLSVLLFSKFRDHSFHRWLSHSLTLSYLIFWKNCNLTVVTSSEPAKLLPSESVPQGCLSHFA